MTGTEASNQPPKKEVFLYADYIRVLATLAVIMLHSSGQLLENYSQANGSSWWTGNILNSCLRWCVPLFVMLSGALLLDGKAENNFSFLRRRAGKVFVPYLFWSLVYLIYVYRYDIRDGNQIKFGEIFYKLGFNEVYYHFWFVSMILGLYLLTPTLRILCAGSSRKDLEYFLVVWFILDTVSTYFPKAFIVKYIGWLAYVGLFLMGHYLKKYDFQQPKKIYQFGWLALLLTPLGTYFLTEQKGDFDDKLYLYLAPNVIIISFALFLYLKNFDWELFRARFPNIHRFVYFFGGISFAVYLVHAGVLDVLKNGYLGFKIYNDNLLGTPLHPALAVPILTIAVTFLSAIIIIVLKKIPFLRNIIG